MSYPPRPTSDVHALAGAYALDAMEAEERALFEGHLDECDACRAEVEELQATAARLGAAAAETPPAGLRDRVLEGARATRQVEVAPARTRAAPRWLPAVAAALALAVIGLATALFLTESRADRLDSTLALVSAPDAQVAVLEGDAAGHVVWSEAQDSAVLFVDDLQAATDDDVYAVWLLHGEDARLAATFADGDARPAAVLEGDVAGADALAITFEPGPVEGPAQGPIVLQTPLA